MRKIAVTAGALAATFALIAAPGGVQAQTYHHHYHHHYRRGCDAARRRAANTGTVIGGIGGALIGNSLSHGGGRLGGTLIGGGIGAVAGHQIAKNGHKC